MALARGSATGLLRRLGWRLSSQEIPPRPQGLSKRGRNLFELAALLPKGGLGVRFVRKSWLRNGYDDSHWTVERIRFEPVRTHRARLALARCRVPHAPRPRAARPRARPARPRLPRTRALRAASSARRTAGMATRGARSRLRAR